MLQSQFNQFTSSFNLLPQTEIEQLTNSHWNWIDNVRCVLTIFMDTTKSDVGRGVITILSDWIWDTNKQKVNGKLHEDVIDEAVSLVREFWPLQSCVCQFRIRLLFLLSWFMLFLPLFSPSPTNTNSVSFMMSHLTHLSIQLHHYWLAQKLTKSFSFLVFLSFILNSPEEFPFLLQKSWNEYQHLNTILLFKAHILTFSYCLIRLSHSNFPFFHTSY